MKKLIFSVSIWIIFFANSRYLNTFINIKLRLPSEMTDKELKEISNAIKAQVKFFDEIYNKSMPYVLWHGFPAKNYAQYWPYHIQFWPLQRGEDKMKYLASVEQITGLFLVDVMPEDAAKQIRDFHRKNAV